MGDGTNQYSDDTTPEIYGTIGSINKETGRDSKPLELWETIKTVSLFNTDNIFNQKMGRFAFINYLWFP